MDNATLITDKEIEEHKIFLILKYGSIETFYSAWLYDKHKDISHDEKMIIAETCNTTIDEMHMMKIKYIRAKHGIFQ